MSSEQQQAEPQDRDQQDDRSRTEKPEVTEEHQEKANEMRKEYVENRPTVIMPGSGGTVAGTAVNEWLEDDGTPKFGDDSESSGDKSYAETVDDDKARNEKIRKAHDEAGKAQSEEPQKAD